MLGISFPNEITQINKIKLYFIVKDESIGVISKLTPLQDKVRIKLRGRVEIFNINHLDDIRVIDHETAKQRGFPIV